MPRRSGTPCLFKTKQKAVWVGASSSGRSRCFRPPDTRPSSCGGKRPSMDDGQNSEGSVLLPTGTGACRRCGGHRPPAAGPAAAAPPVRCCAATSLSTSSSFFPLTARPSTCGDADTHNQKGSEMNEGGSGRRPTQTGAKLTGWRLGGQVGQGVTRAGDPAAGGSAHLEAVLQLWDSLRAELCGQMAGGVNCPSSLQEAQGNSLRREKAGGVSAASSA